jgi:hypothetical protein
MGELFGTDPIQLLNCSEDEWLIRLACAKVISNDREEQEKQRQKAEKSGR